MADPVPRSDVSRPSALPTAHLLQRSTVPLIDQNSNEYLDAIEEDWNKKVDTEIDILVDGMVDLVGLASVGHLGQPHGLSSSSWADWRQGQVQDSPGGLPGRVSGRIDGT